MNIWFFLILLLVFSLVLGPIMMLRPKPAQKRKEALRQYAAGNGVRFTMRKLPKLKTDLDEPGISPVYYLAPTTQMQSLPTWVLMRTHYEHEGNFFRTWDFQGENRPDEKACSILREYLPNLPESVPVISQGKVGSCVFWSEKEDRELLDILIKLLKALQANVV